MTVLLKILQVILALSVLILIHELGHFMWAKIFRIRVDKFYLFFDVGGVKLFSFKIGDTEYGMGWLPLGGYCKIAGMIDESMDIESMHREPQPWEFRTHPAWQRLLVMGGGVLNNFILAIVIFIIMLAIWGDTYVSNADKPIYVNELAYDMGFRTGDRILRFDDYVPDDFLSLQADLARRNVRVATVLRGADTLDIYIDQNLIGDVLETPGMFDLAMPFVVDSVMAGGPNAGIGLLRGDRIVSVDGTDTPYLQDARKIMALNAGSEVSLGVFRGADTLTLQARLDSLGMLGVFFARPEFEHREYNLIQAVPAGFGLTFSTVGGYLRDLKLVATPSTGAYKSVGSFIAIGQVFPSTWNWNQFLYILALLSIMLGVMNLLPIPALDGGHMVICIYEMITRRKPSERFLVVAQMIGFVLLIGLMILAFGNDIGRLIK